MAATHTEPKMSKWKHALLMMLAAPAIGYVISGFIYGFSAIGATPMDFFLNVAEWFGATLIGLVVSVIAMIWAGRAKAWAILVVLTGVLMNIGSPIKPNGTAKRISNGTESLQAEPAASTSEDALVAVAYVEKLEPGMTEVVDDDLISRFEDMMKKDARSKIEGRVRRAGEDVPPFLVDVSTGKLSVQNRELYATEINISTQDGTEQGIPRMIVLWNLMDGSFKRVYCAFPDRSYAYRSGKCGAQMAETFGWAGWHTD